MVNLDQGVDALQRQAQVRRLRGLAACLRSARR